MIRRNFIAALFAPLVSRFAPNPPCQELYIVPLHIGVNDIAYPADPFPKDELRRMAETQRKLMIIQLHKMGYVAKEELPRLLDPGRIPA